jgi:hypothetical protein
VDARSSGELSQLVLGSSDGDIALGLATAANGIRAAGLRAAGCVASSQAEHQRAVLTCRESPVASSASGGTRWISRRPLLAGRRTRPPERRRRCFACLARLLSASQIGRHGGLGPSAGALAFAASGPSPAGASPFVPVIRHPPAAHRCRSCSCVLSRKACGRRRHRLPCGDVTGRRCCRKGRRSGPSPWGRRVSSSARPVRCAATRPSSDPGLGARWKWEDVAAAILDCRGAADGQRRVGLGGG